MLTDTNQSDLKQEASDHVLINEFTFILHSYLIVL